MGCGLAGEQPEQAWGKIDAQAGGLGGQGALPIALRNQLNIKEVLGFAISLSSGVKITFWDRTGRNEFEPVEGNHVMLC
jgi:hypothetical protein